MSLKQWGIMSEHDKILDLRRIRGEEAERLLNNELLVSTLRSMEDECLRQLKMCKPNDMEVRDAYWRELRAIGRFADKLKSYAVTGREAKKTLMQRVKEKL